MRKTDARAARSDYRVDFERERSQNRRVQSPKKGHGLLLERGGRCESRRGDAFDGTLVFDYRQGYPLDNEGKSQKETARANECRVGAAFTAATRAQHTLAGTVATFS